MPKNDYEPATSALKFLTLQTNEGAYTCVEPGHPDCDTRRKVSLAYDGHQQFPHVRLLGNLEHQTEFTKEDLLAFARDILAAFAPENRGNPIPCTYGTGRVRDPWDKRPTSSKKDGGKK